MSLFHQFFTRRDARSSIANHLWFLYSILPVFVTTYYYSGWLPAILPVIILTAFVRAMDELESSSASRKSPCLRPYHHQHHHHHQHQHQYQHQHHQHQHQPQHRNPQKPQKQKPFVPIPTVPYSQPMKTKDGISSGVHRATGSVSVGVGVGVGVSDIIMPDLTDDSVVAPKPKKRKKRWRGSPKRRRLVGPTLASSSYPAAPAGTNDPIPCPIPARITSLVPHDDTATGEPVIPSPDINITINITIDPPRRSARIARIAARNIPRILMDPLGSIVVNGRRRSARLV